MSSSNLISKQHRAILLAVAKESIKFGLHQNTSPPFDPDIYPRELTSLGASFVTLKVDSELQGCIGTLYAHRPLAQDIAENAYQAAFSDPRFSPVTRVLYQKLHLHISVLTAPEEIHFDSEQTLLDQLNPYVDGLILQEGNHKGTFLPSVWESLPEPDEFLSHLKHKAGLPSSYWSNGIRAFRYYTVSIE